MLSEGFIVILLPLNALELAHLAHSFDNKSANQRTPPPRTPHQVSTPQFCTYVPVMCK